VFLHGCKSLLALLLLLLLLLAGNHNATAFVYDATTGCQVTRVEPIKVQGSVRTCGLSEDCRHLLLVAGSGYVFTFEHTPAQVAAAPDADSMDEGP
jgi:hypothetical protein